ncbi:MAG: hypothetical protein RBR08_09275 [Desulforegulaceae bacterium]|nr:hypothetical protein [Desulforegulaceae bacterium]
MKKKLILLFLLFFTFTFQSCSKEKIDQTTDFSTTFQINQILKDKKNISFDLEIFFDFKNQLDYALSHKENFFHAAQITMQKYHLEDLKGKKLKILLNDILNQVFRGHAQYFEVSNLKEQ